MLQFALLFANRKSADESMVALAREGFDVELQPQSGNDLWVVSAVPEKSEPMEAASDRMNEIAADYGGEYLGHGGIWTTGIGQAGRSN